MARGVQLNYVSYPCPRGYLCNGGAVHPSKIDNVSIQLCPPGFFCDKANVSGLQQAKQSCPINFYQSIYGQAECFPCPAGYHCAEVETITPVACARGHYCISPTKDFDTTLADAKNSIVEATKIACPPGTYNSDELAMSPSDCQKCPPGKWCEGGKQ